MLFEHTKCILDEVSYSTFLFSGKYFIVENQGDNISIFFFSIFSLPLIFTLIWHDCLNLHKESWYKKQTMNYGTYAENIFSLYLQAVYTLIVWKTVFFCFTIFAYDSCMNWLFSKPCWNHKIHFPNLVMWPENIDLTLQIIWFYLLVFQNMYIGRHISL